MAPEKKQIIDNLTDLFSNELNLKGDTKDIIAQVVEGKISHKAAASSLFSSTAIQNEVVQMFEKAKACANSQEINALLDPHFKIIKTLQTTSKEGGFNGGGGSSGGGGASGGW